MTRASIVIRMRDLALRAIDRSSVLRGLAARVAHGLLRRRGPLNVIADEALAGAAGREAKRTAEMLQWSSAVAGASPFPKYFPAAHHIQSAEGRRLSSLALAKHLADHPDASAHLWRQYVILSEPDDLTEAAAFVERDLADHLAGKSTSGDDERPSMSSAGQMEILRRAYGALTPAGVRPFLVSGTLLGFVRDGRLLAHDYDIDLGVLPGDADASTIGEALEAAGFDVTVQELKVVARDESDFAVDVFLHYERDGLLWHGTEIHEWWNTPFELVEADLDGLSVLVPADAETYLRENYGTWERPIAFYNFSFDTPNRVYRRNHHALLYLHRRVIRGLEAGDRWSVESAARELRDQFGVDVTAALQPTPLLQGPDTTDPRG